jgi:hypothetical protein
MAICHDEEINNAAFFSRGLIIKPLIRMSCALYAECNLSEQLAADPNSWGDEMICRSLIGSREIGESLNSDEDKKFAITL